VVASWVGDQESTYTHKTFYFLHCVCAAVLSQPPILQVSPSEGHPNGGPRGAPCPPPSVSTADMAESSTPVAAPPPSDGEPKTKFDDHSAAILSRLRDRPKSLQLLEKFTHQQQDEANRTRRRPAPPSHRRGSDAATRRTTASSADQLIERGAVSRSPDGAEEDPETLELARLRCPSECTEVIAEREIRRRQRRCADYPGFAFGSSMFSSDSMMKFNIIKNELHNIMNTQLKRVSMPLMGASLPPAPLQRNVIINFCPRALMQTGSFIRRPFFCLTCLAISSLACSVSKMRVTHVGRVLFSFAVCLLPDERDRRESMLSKNS
jgi:hypothetical protein